MNLRATANSRTQTINPNLVIELLRSNGYTVGPAFKQIPAFISVSGEAQIQALSGKDLMHLNNMNIQGVSRKVYLYGNWMGVVRSDEKGGDVLVFPQAPGEPNQQWKIRTVFETWPDWCAVGVSLQVGTVATGGV